MWSGATWSRWPPPIPDGCALAGPARAPRRGGFWYRQSPRTLLRPLPLEPPIFLRGPVQLTNPSPVVAGEVIIMLDLAGNLRRLDVMPKRLSTREPTEPDWSLLFRLANLDTARFTEVRPRYQRYQAPDLRRAWLGPASRRRTWSCGWRPAPSRGKPVLFNVATEAGLANLGDDPQPRRRSLGEVALDSLTPAIILVVIFFAIKLVRTNSGQGRADKRGATRVAMMGFTLFLVAKGLRSHALFTSDWASEVWPLLVGATFMAFAAWSMYMAAEPIGRRVWPTMFVSLSRLMSRERVEWRDPLMGQSVLAGLFMGGLTFCLRGPFYYWLAGVITDQPTAMMGSNLLLLRGQRLALAVVFDQAMVLGLSFVMVLVLVLMQALVKRRRWSVLLAVIVWTLMSGVGGLEQLLLNLVAAAILMTTLLRFGVMAMVVHQVVLGLAWQARVADWSAWYAEGPLIVLAALAVLAVYGAWAASAPGGRRRIVGPLDV